jgi:hypothetical protein
LSSNTILHANFAQTRVRLFHKRNMHGHACLGHAQERDPVLILPPRETPPCAG